MQGDRGVVCYDGMNSEAFEHVFREHQVMRILLLTMLVLTLPALAQDWSKTRLEVLPGIGIGAVKLGQPVPRESLKFLGEPSRTQEAGEEPGSGYLLWGQGNTRDFSKGLLVRLGEPGKKDVVTSALIRGARVATDKGLYIGATVALLRKKYPEAQLDVNPITGQSEWCIPGLIMRLKGDKVVEMAVEPFKRFRWRFNPLKIVPGVSAGPFVLGKAVPPEVLAKYGEPTFRQPPKTTANSGLIRWSTPGGDPNRFIELTLHDGARREAVTCIRVKGLPATTNEDVKLGDRAQLVKAVYPQGRTGLSTAAQSELWRLNGITFVLLRGRLVEMQLYPLAKPVR